MRDPFFSQFGTALTAFGRAHPHAAWEPAVDLYRCRGGWLLKVELAGVRPEDIRVTLAADGVSIAGRRMDRCEYELEEAHLIEIAYSSFERFVPLPESVKDPQYRVEAQNGMLYIQVLEAQQD
jgi:HSP20 family protein